MTTSDWALTVSLFSLFTAMASFVWNVWSKFIYPKPNVIVSLMVMRVVGSQPARKHIQLHVTNFGPGDVVVDCAVVKPKKSWYKRRVKLGILNPINDLRNPEAPTGPFGGGLPKRLAPCEDFTLYFPYDANTFLNEPLGAIGAHDSFRRNHWAPSRDLQEVMRQYRSDFVK